MARAGARRASLPVIHEAPASWADEWPNAWRLIGAFVVEDSQRPYRLEPHIECERGQPCPWVSCRYHLWHERARHDRYSVDEVATAIVNAAETCALDVASDGARSDAEVAELLGISRMQAWRIGELGKVEMGLNPKLEAPDERPEVFEPETWQAIADLYVLDRANERRRRGGR